MPVEHMMGDDEEDTRLLRAMLEEALSYMRSWEWCPAIARAFFGYGVGNVVAVFLFELAQPIDQRDRYLWCIVGDLPTAYLVVDQATTPDAALAAYCRLMEDWAQSVLDHRPMERQFPVRTQPTEGNARQLLSRTEFLRREIIPDAKAFRGER